MKFPKLPFLFVIIVSVTTVLYVATNGFFDLRKIYHLPALNLPILFETMWENLLEGRVDLPYEAGAWESFEINGRYYVYFGFFPAVVRFFLLLIMGSSWYGRLGIVSCVIASSLISAFAFLIIYESIKCSHFKSKFTKTAFLILVSLTIVIGSPVVTSVVRSGVWEELVLWGFVFSLIGLYGFIKFVDNQKSDLAIFLLSSAASLALITRATFGVPLYILLAIVFFVLVSQHQVSSKKFCLFSISGLGIAFQLWYNYARFGSIFAFFPSGVPHYYFGETVEHGGVVNLYRLKETFFYYFIPELGDQTFSFEYPFFFTKDYIFQDKTIFFQYVCHVIPSLRIAPYFLFFPLAAIYVFLLNLIKRNKENLIIMLASLAPFIAEVIVVLGYNCCTERYKVEFLPLVLISAFFCFRQLRSRKFLLFVSILCIMSCAFTLLHTISYRQQVL